MAERNLKLTSLTGGNIDSAELSADYREADAAGHFRVGRKGFYYRSGLKKIYIPLSDIDHAFTRVQEVSTHMCCCGYSMYVYRLVLCSGGKEIADINVDVDEASVNKAQALLKDRIPDLQLGYRKPEEMEA